MTSCPPETAPADPLAPLARLSSSGEGSGGAPAPSNGRGHHRRGPPGDLAPGRAWVHGVPDRGRSRVRVQGPGCRAGGVPFHRRVRPNSTILHYDENRRTLAGGGPGGRGHRGRVRVLHRGPHPDLSRKWAFHSSSDGLVRPGPGVLGCGAGSHPPRGNDGGGQRGGPGAFWRPTPGTSAAPTSCAPFLIHGVSHWLGMDVHDVGDNRTSVRCRE